MSSGMSGENVKIWDGFSVFERLRTDMPNLMKEESDMLLSVYRVLDLCDDKGMFAGKILADMGADVIKVEKPGGDPVRKRGPFHRDIPDPEKSLFWFAYNNGKRGMTLDITTTKGPRPAQEAGEDR